MTAPLDGIVVVEAGRFISAPLAGMILADFGATVIKIEAPDGGDPFRAWRPNELSPRFVAVNRTKRSLALDLRDADDLQAARRLLDKADVFIHNFRQDFIETVGLDHEALSRTNRRLVYCEVSGSGNAASLAGTPMYDAIGQALSGLTAVTADPTQPAGPSMSDSVTGYSAAMGILAALNRRHVTGNGSLVRASMISSSVSFLSELYTYFLVTGERPDALTRVRQSQSFSFRCSDGGMISIHLSTPKKFWEAFTGAINRVDLRPDKRFTSYTDRVDNYLALRDELTGEFLTKPAQVWLKILREVDVPCAEITQIPEVLSSQIAEELDLLRPYADWPESPGSVLPAVEMSGMPQPRKPPELGADNAWLRTFLGEGEA